MQNDESDRKPGDEASAHTPQTAPDRCRQCGGTGRFKGDACSECNGTGTVTVNVGDA
jgi:DnaJ-class molecular chaperone